MLVQLILTGNHEPNPSEIVFERDERGDRVELGRGSFSTVYKAKWRGKDVAVKELLPYLAKDTAVIDLYRKEFKLMKSFQQRNIVRVFCAWIDDPNSPPTMVMELLPMTLAQAMRDPLFDIPKREPAMRQLAETVASLHSRSPMVLHCDLKPQNILMTENFDPKLCDFGSAKKRFTTLSIRNSVAHTTKGVRGTPWYIVCFVIDSKYDCN